MVYIGILATLVGLVLIALLFIDTTRRLPNESQSKPLEGQDGAGSGDHEDARAAAAPQASPEGASKAARQKEPFAASEPVSAAGEGQVASFDAAGDEWSCAPMEVDAINRQSMEKRRYTVVSGTCFSGAIGRV